MAELNYTIPNDKLTEYVEAYVYVHKNTETIDNPDFVSFEDTPNEPQFIAKYTDAQWVKQHILRTIRGQIVRGKNAMARAALTNVSVDDVIETV